MALVLVTVSACAAERDRAPATTTWVDDIGPAFAARCTVCHGDGAPAAAYGLTTYLGALGAGADAVANAIAGDAEPRLLVVLGDAGDATHAAFVDLVPVVRAWIVDDDLAYAGSTIHPPGVLDPGSGDFHGREIAARGWDLGLCANCHGGDYGGGLSGVSCNGCHTRGPTACDTCHEERPTTGAHGEHADLVDCATCHAVPTRWDDPGHLVTGGVVDTAPADVVMTGLAALTIDPADRAGPPAYTGGTCANVYCHGAVLGPAGGASTAPAWIAAPGPAPCGACHGEPPPSHGRDDCATCHPAAPGDRHLDGATDIGLGLPGCSGCHGGTMSAAPPRDLAGNTLTTALGVGAHQAHLQGPHRIAAPIACEACHAVPATVTAPGHLDTAPAELVATLGWDRDAGTCATAWCHGPARPVWTTTGDVACGTCHGIPPATAAHTPGLPLTACAGCHPSTVDAFGNLLVDGSTSAHLDGDVDAP